MADTHVAANQPRPAGAPMMPHGHVPPVFGPLLQSLIDERGWSMREFAVLVGRSHTQVRRIIDGDRTPDPDVLDKWADVLVLSKAKRAEFIWAGRSARAKGKADSSDYVRDLERRVAKLTQQAEAAETNSTRLRDALTSAVPLIELLLERLRALGDQNTQGVEEALGRFREVVRARS